MMSSDLVRILLDAEAAPADRLRAATALRDAADRQSYDALVTVASDPHTPVEVAVEAGRAVAHVSVRLSLKFDVPWGDFTEAASDAWDHEGARIQGDIP